MSCYLHADSNPDVGSVYVRENGQLYRLNQASSGINSSAPKPRPSRLFSKGFSVELCVNRENDNGRTDHFIFTYTKEGNLRYTAKSLFSLVLSYIADNIHHVDSLTGFPEQIAEKLFYAADARQKFSEPRIGLGALQKFTEAYGSLVLRMLCLKNRFKKTFYSITTQPYASYSEISPIEFSEPYSQNSFSTLQSTYNNLDLFRIYCIWARYLLISEKLEEIKSFRDLTCLDLSFCKLGDKHELVAHLTSETLSSLTRLLLKDNCLSDAGLRKMTAPVRVMKRGLENLLILDLSCNPGITNMGVGYLLSFKKLNYLDLSGTGLKDTKAAVHQIQTQIGLVHSEVSLKEFDHNSCKTEGWAEQTVLQWEQTIQEAVVPEGSLKSRAEAQRFYGKRARKEVLGSPLGEKDRGTLDNLQFYKKKAEVSHFPLGKTERSKELQNKRRISAEHKEQNLKSKRLNISVDDWDLLNSY